MKKNSIPRSGLPGWRALIGGHREIVKLSPRTGSLIAIALLLLAVHPASATNRTVTNLNDSGAGSLRDTIAASTDGDTINFSVTGTIGLTSAELAIAHSITINGPGANVLIVSNSNGGTYRIFDITSGTVSISGLTISNGLVQFAGSSIGGGGIRNNGTLTLNNCAISSNQAQSSFVVAGGGIWNDTSGTLTIVNCTLSNNHASATSNALGGGIYNTGALILIDSTVNGNAAAGGGGEFGGQASGGGIVNVSSGTLSMTNCTVSNNSATGYAGASEPGNATGGGIYQSSGINPSLRNTIIAGNNVNAYGVGGTPTDPDVFGTFNSQGHNLVGNTGDSSGWIASDKTDATATPLNLGPLQQAGGPTQTMPLRNGSVAIDAGDDSVLGPPLNLTTDQRGPGFARSAGAHVDIGAVEFRVQSGPAFIVTTTDDRDDGVCADECTLRDAINAANTAPGDNTITFASGVSGTIQLGSALPNLSTNMSMQGPGASVLIVRPNPGDTYRVLTVSNGTTSGPAVSISGLTISHGTTSGSSYPGAFGGGIFGDYAALTVSNCLITRNTARYGGGLANVHGTLTVSNSTLDGNVSTTDGGGIYDYGSGSANSSSDLIVTNSTFNGNTASGDVGGGINNYGGVISLTNCTFYNNSAFNGGAFENQGVGVAVSATLRSCTFSGNTTTSANPADVLNQAVFGGTAILTLDSNIFKTGAQGANLFNNGGTILSQGYNLSNDAAGGDGTTGPGGLLNAPGDIRNTDPLLGSLANNGGPTLTVALLSGSPAINHGDPNAPLQDQRYYLRSGAPDIGAFEFAGPLAPISAVSRKTHGISVFDINLPLSGTAGVECRSGGATNDHLLVVTFPTSVTVTNAQVTTGTGTAFQLDNDGHGRLTIHLTGVANVQRIVTTLFGVSDGMNMSNVTIPMGVLLGDTTGNGSVNASDVSLTKLKSGQTVDATNFREDVTVNAVINSSDVSTVKLKSGTALP